jgi:hypothetical protein
VQDLIYPFGIVRDIAVVSVLGKEQDRTILGILRIIAPEQIVGIFYSQAGVGKVTVNYIRTREGRSGHRLHQFPVLLEKWLRKIIIVTIVHRIPFVRYPAIPAIDRERAIRRVDTDHGFAAEVAVIAVKGLLLSPDHTPHVPAIRAPGRRRHVYFLIEIKVLRLYPEFNLAIGAYLFLGFRNTSNISQRTNMCFTLIHAGCLMYACKKRMSKKA